ncbi:MAG: tetratricopeptide repeat protein [Oribacterium sp.]
MMKCRNCGTEIPAASRFCPNCGLLTNIYIDFSEAYHPVDAVEYKLPERIAARIAARLESAGALAARPEPETEERGTEDAEDTELSATEIEETEVIEGNAEAGEPEANDAEASAAPSSAVDTETEAADKEEPEELAPENPEPLQQPAEEPTDTEVSAEAGEPETNDAEASAAPSSAVDTETEAADKEEPEEPAPENPEPLRQPAEEPADTEVSAEAGEPEANDAEASAVPSSAVDTETEAADKEEAMEAPVPEQPAVPLSDAEAEAETADKAEEIEVGESAPENPELMRQLAEELEKRRQAQETEELSLLNKRVLERIRQITGLDGTAQPKEDEAAAPVEPEAAEETEEPAESARIHDIADYREETLSEEDAEPAEILPMEELVAEEEQYTGPDPAFEKLATMPPDPKHWRSAFRQNRRLLVPFGTAVIALAVVVFYMNTPEAKQGRLLRKGQKLVAEQNYDAAVPLLTRLLDGEADSQEVYLLLSEAYLNSGRHEDAVKLLSEAVEKLPEDSVLAAKLRAIHPLVSISPSGETAGLVYTDPLELSLSNADGQEIHYTLRGGSEEVTDALYQEPIELRYSGDYQLSAYAIASDGVHGPLAEAEYQISLDPEKYHLNDWVETEGGRSFIDGRGETVKGWLYQEDKAYYFDENGYLLTGLQTIGQDSYYFASDGAMQTGWAELDGKRYFFDADGRMLRSAWIDETYYVGDDGVMLRDTTIDGVYVDANGARSFQAAAEYAAHPNMILLAKSNTRVDRGSYFEIDAELYYEKAEGRPSGEADRALKIKLQKDAWLHYLDGDLISIQAKDAVKFLPELYMQDIRQNEDGEITSFRMLLGKNR